MLELVAIPPAGAHRPEKPPPLSGAIRTGDFVWVSGQTSKNLNTGEVISGDAGAQTGRVLDNLEAQLKAAGSSLDRVVRCTVYLTEEADLPHVNAAYIARFKPPFPARTAVIVRALPHPEYRVEIEAVAIVSPRAHRRRSILSFWKRLGGGRPE